MKGYFNHITFSIGITVGSVLIEIAREGKDSCITAKDAWKALKVAFEGTSKVKISRLLLLTSKFESLRMMEEETISEYNSRVLEIANDSFNFDEGIPESRLVRKVLRLLPRRFDMKVTAMEEAQDITTLCLLMNYSRRFALLKLSYLIEMRVKGKVLLSNLFMKMILLKNLNHQMIR